MRFAPRHAALALLSTLSLTACVIQPLPDGAGTPGSSQVLGRAPIIQALDASPKQVTSKSDKISFTVVASAPNGQPLQYNWTSTKGILSATSGQNVYWQSGDDTGPAVVTVIVSDGLYTTSGNVNIQINANGTTNVLGGGPAPAPAATPTPVPSAAATPVPSASPSPTPAPSVSASPSVSPSAVASTPASASPSVAPSVAPSAVPSAQ